MKNLVKTNQYIAILLVMSAPLFAAKWRNVQTSYGAVPNDGMDDTAALQSALNWADNTSEVRNLAFPAGTYDVGTLQIGNNTRLNGQPLVNGEPTVIIRRINGIGGILLKNKNHGPNSSGNTGVQIKKIRFDGRNQGGDVIQLYNTSNVLVENSDVINSGAYGLRFRANQTTSNITVDSCFFEGNYFRGLSASVDFKWKGALEDPDVPVTPNQVVEAGLIQEVTFINCVSQNNRGTGIGLWGVTNATVKSCDSLNNGTEADSKHGSGFGNDANLNVTYENCHAEGNRDNGFANGPNGDFFFADGSSVLRSNAKMTYKNCSARNNQLDGLRLHGVEDIPGGFGAKVLGGSFNRNGDDGLSLKAVFEHPTSDIEIRGVTVKENNAHGIRLRGVNNVTIEDWNGERSAIIDNGRRNSNGSDDGIHLSSIITSARGLSPSYTHTTRNVAIRNCTIGNTWVNGNGFQRRAVTSTGDTNNTTVRDNIVSARGGGTAISLTDSNKNQGNNQKVTYIDSTH